MGRQYTYRTAARRVRRSIRELQNWRRYYGMRTSIDEEGMVCIAEGELLRCYRLALSRSNIVKSRRRRLLAQDVLFPMHVPSRHPEGRRWPRRRTAAAPTMTDMLPGAEHWGLSV